jgi:hypothetical protein
MNYPGKEICDMVGKAYCIFPYLSIFPYRPSNSRKWYFWPIIKIKWIVKPSCPCVFCKQLPLRLSWGHF